MHYYIVNLEGNHSVIKISIHLLKTRRKNQDIFILVYSGSGSLNSTSNIKLKEAPFKLHSEVYGRSQKMYPHLKKCRTYVFQCNYLFVIASKLLFMRKNRNNCRLQHYLEMTIMRNNIFTYGDNRDFVH